MEKVTNTKTILVVEDFEGLNLLISEKLNECGYQSVSVYNGNEALHWLNTNDPYLMVLDYSLPDMNGQELLDTLGREGRTIPPFIISTGQGDESIAVSMMKLGARDYLVKNSFFLDILPEVLKRIETEIDNENRRKWAENELINSEQKYREMADALPVGVFETDLNGTITFVNQTIKNWLGYNSDDFKNEVNLVNFVVDEDRKKAKERSQRVMIEKTTATREYILKRKSGNTIPVIVSSMPIIKNQQAIGLRGTIVDITERKRAEVELKQSEARLSALLSSMKDIIFEIDLNGCFEGYYAQDVKGLYVPPDFFISKKFDEVLPPNVSKLLKGAIEHIYEGNPFEQFEYSLTVDNNIQFESAIVTPRYNTSNEIIGITVVCRDITERKFAERALSSLATNFAGLSGKTFFEAVSKHIATDMGIDYVYVGELTDNKNSVRVLGGFALGEAMGEMTYGLADTPCHDVIENNSCIYPSGIQLQYPDDFLLQQMGIDSYLGARIYNKEQEPIGLLVALHSKPLNNADILVNLFSIFLDRIAAEMHRMHAYEALHKNEAVQRKMVSNIGDVIVIIDKNGINQYKSPNITKLFGWNPEELVGKNTWDNVHPDDLDATQKFLGAIATEPNTTGTTELRYKHKNGNYVWIEITVVNLLHDNDIQGFLGNYQDITLRKMTESKLRESESQMKSLFENAADAIFIADIETGIIVDANKTAEQLLKKPLDKIIGSHQAELHPKEVEKYSQQAFKNQKEEILKSVPIIPVENDLVCADGTLIPIEVLASRVIYKGKDCMMGTFRNITERKKAESIISDQAEQMSVLLSTTPDGFFKMNDQGIIVEVSKKMAQLTGYAPNELTNKPLRTLEAKETEEDIKSHIKSIMDLKYGIFESKYTTKSGEKIDVEISTSYWSDKKQFLVFVRDISERKLNEKELIKTKNKLQKAQIMAKLGNYEIDLDTKAIKASDEAFNIYGIPNTNSYIPLYKAQQLPLPEYRPLMDNALQLLITKNEPYDLEFQILHGFDNSIRTIHSVAELEKDANDKPIKVVGVIQDISDQKKLENELRVLSNAIEQNPASIVITDTKGDIEYINPKFTQITGYTRDEAIGKNPRVLKTGFTSPEVYSNLWATISSGNIWQGEFCNKKKDGTQFWESALISPVLDTYGKIIHYVAVKEDITDKKETENKILRAVIEGEERERNRFSRELHDGLGPLLSSIKLYFQWISKMEDPEKKQFLTGKGNHSIDEAILTLREISNNLSPQSLNTFGLVLALKNYVEGLNQLNIHIDLTSNFEKRFNKNIEIALYRITLELINNCLKHADATEIKIGLHYIELINLIRLTYKDNGKGFNLETQTGKTKGRGILNIQYRVNSLNGKINMKSSPGNGMEMTIEVPIGDGK